jgi:hypothetical protein
MNAAQIEQAAKLLKNARINNRVIDCIPEAIRPENLSEAYAVQDRWPRPRKQPLRMQPLVDVPGEDVGGARDSRLTATILSSEYQLIAAPRSTPQSLNKFLVSKRLQCILNRSPG